MDEELSKAIEDGTVGPKADPKDEGWGMEAMGMMGWDYESRNNKNQCFSRCFGFQWEKLQDEYISWYDFRS